MKSIPRNVHKQLDNNALQVNSAFKRNLIKQLQGEAPVSNKKNGFIIPILIKNNLMNIALAISVLGVVGGASAAVNGNRIHKEQLQQVALPTSLEGVLSLDEIRAKAQTAVAPNISINGVELEQENGVLFYKVKFNDGSFRLFNAKTGEAVTATSNLEQENSPSVPASFAAGIDIQTAKAAAQRQRPGATITKIELENEEGIVVYTVKFSDGGRVLVDAKDGSITKVFSGSDTKNTSTSENDKASEEESDDDEDDEKSKSAPSPTPSVSNGSTEEDEDESDGSNSGSGSNDSEKSDKEDKSGHD